MNNAAKLVAGGTPDHAGAPLARWSPTVNMGRLDADTLAAL